MDRTFLSPPPSLFLQDHFCFFQVIVSYFSDAASPTPWYSPIYFEPASILTEQHRNACLWSQAGKKKRIFGPVSYSSGFFCPTQKAQRIFSRSFNLNMKPCQVLSSFTVLFTRGKWKQMLSYRASCFRHRSELSPSQLPILSSAAQHISRTLNFCKVLRNTENKWTDNWDLKEKNLL